MQVDNPLSQSFSFNNGPSSFEDFFNMDMLSSSSSSGPSSSGGRSASRSPSHSYSNLPPTPPQPFIFPPSYSSAMGMSGTVAPLDPDSFFNFASLEDELMSKAEGLLGPPPLPTTISPFDFLNGTAPGSAFSSSPSSGGSPATNSFSHPSSSGSSNSSVSALSPAPILAIDPQLVGTPSTSKAMSDFDEEEEDAYNQAQADAEEEEAMNLQEEEEENVGVMEIVPVKVAGKGKGRKGTVASGGVVKKSSLGPPPSSAKASALSAVGSGPLKENKEKRNGVVGSGVPTSAVVRQGSEEADDWRPSPEEYKKMSSKEKRQLRNKISARNFRIRRKEYITTLEGDVAERDRLLDLIRGELSSTKSENASLRQEISALKKALLEGRLAGEPSPLPPPGPLPTVSAAQRAQAASNGAQQQMSGGVQRAGSRAASKRAQAGGAGSSKDGLVTANVAKDLPLSPRMAGTKAFWGGSAGGFGGVGGITPVHTTLVPEFSLINALSGKVAASGGVGPRGSPPLQENINPALNGLGAGLGGNGMQSQKGFNGEKKVGGFENWVETNPFTMKSLDAYRMHLWSKMAQQQHQYQQQQQLAQQPTAASFAQQLQQQAQQSAASRSASPTSSQPGLSGLASGLRPHYFTNSNGSSSKVPLSAVSANTLSGKASSSYSYSNSGASAYPSPSASPQLQPAGLRDGRDQQPTPQQAMLAAVASQTILGRLGSAFWEAFSGSSGTSPVGLGGSKAWDQDKVRRVLEGKAVLKVVDIEHDEKEKMPANPATQSTQTPTQASVVVKKEETPVSLGCAMGRREDVCEKACEAVKCRGKLVIENVKKDGLGLLEESMRSLSLARK
ncbi:hypothetical protein JAAARDRAFT_32353 [Jaapia argillacea MUCL 33604]|uniref:BZIP domain-containing protein n=1 Tax=Jaapia argillacea MUCL 33604 TaxID=933084 RepID=A0A067PZ75_9AGAM|nr:hypothetical protein JAAARDRAFT_32353 [Jaapia argillacea MUCL 33604]